LSFLLDEDYAIRKILQGITVTDQAADGTIKPARQVGVWFGQPDQEIRTQNYPYITIDLIDVMRDTQREVRGKTDPQYLTPVNLYTNQNFQVNYPIPVVLDYQITTYARHPRHDRELLATLMTYNLPMRYGYLEIDSGLQDSDGNNITTIRRMDVLDVSKRDSTEQAKRLFVNAVTVRVSSELPPQQVDALQQVTSVTLQPLDPAYNSGRTSDPYFRSPTTFTITA
jgi:hypothetical protein